MKYCPDCGSEFPDEESVCPQEHTALISCGPAEGATVPVGFERFCLLDALEAEGLLTQFSEAGLSFRIERVERRQKAGHMYKTVGLIQIYVRAEDLEKAMGVYSADWKV